MNNLMIHGFEKFLENQFFTKQSIKSYAYHVSVFLNHHPDANNYSYSKIINYLDGLASDKSNVNYRVAILAIIKKYYDYLIESGQRDEHPCRNITIKNKSKSPIIVQDFFNSEELERLMNREERFPILKSKNQAIISLLIYQGLCAGEIVHLKVQHIDLDKGKVFVKESKDLTRRHLDLHPRQYRLLDNYIRESRKALMKTESDALFYGSRGMPITVVDINYLLKQFKPLFPDKNLNSFTVRQSVICIWLNERHIPLETVQLMAGHRFVSSTARYRQNSMEEKRALINRIHPFS